MRVMRYISMGVLGVCAFCTTTINVFSLYMYKTVHTVCARVQL